MLLCPDCRTDLAELRCPSCHVQFATVDGIPDLLPRDARFREATEIADAYDVIYEAGTNIWEREGRTTEFLQYYSALIGSYLGDRYLEIGCGEGYLLAAVDAREKFGTDLSAKALARARTRSDARLHLALAERLPFPSEHFDVLGAAGVMEHFIDDAEALAEVRRVLVPGGHFITLSHVVLTLAERIGIKLRQFVFPRPRPLELARWVLLRIAPGDESPPWPQPIHNRYTTRKARAALKRAGFEVSETLHTRNNPGLPLIGPYAVVFVCRK
jgi:SAM-dependent methyltransferase